MSNIYWIGGSPCSGKSTVTNVLAERYGWRTYLCDDAFYEHQRLVTPEQQPMFSRLRSYSCDEIWMRPVTQQIEEELVIYREEFPFIMQDLKSLAATGPVIAEGAALLPELLETLGVERNRAIWIVPTAEFQRSHYEQRAWRHDVLRTCSDPEQAWHNWMARDAGFAIAVAEDARQRGYVVLTIDGSISVEHTIRSVAVHFGLDQAESPS